MVQSRSTSRIELMKITKNNHIHCFGVEVNIWKTHIFVPGQVDVSENVFFCDLAELIP